MAVVFTNASAAMRDLLLGRSKRLRVNGYLWNAKQVCLRLPFQGLNSTTADRPMWLSDPRHTVPRRSDKCCVSPSHQRITYRAVMTLFPCGIAYHRVSERLLGSSPERPISSPPPAPRCVRAASGQVSETPQGCRRGRHGRARLQWSMRHVGLGFVPRGQRRPRLRRPVP